MQYSPIIQALFSYLDYQVDVLRLDLIDKEISGNKWFKLKFNLEEAKQKNINQVLTFGGAFSNHIAATAAACKTFNIPCIGVIRGEKSTTLNNTLKKAQSDGMQLHFVSRSEYSLKHNELYIKKLKNLFGEFYLIPEGGNNELGILGCTEIVDPKWDYDYIFCACGTGATYTGIVASCGAKQIVIGINVLKGENSMVQDVSDSLHKFFPNDFKPLRGNEELQNNIITHHMITNAYAFKGYASYDPELILFKSEFEKVQRLKLDYIYTSKLAYALFDLMKLKKLKENSKVLMIHSGGLQGNAGFEARYHVSPIL